MTVRAGGPLAKETCFYPSASELTLDDTTAPLALKMFPSHFHSAACTFQMCICFFRLRLDFSVPVKRELFQQLSLDIPKGGKKKKDPKKMTPLTSQVRASLGGEGLNYGLTEIISQKESSTLPYASPSGFSKDVSHRGLPRRCQDITWSLND